MRIPILASTAAAALVSGCDTPPTAPVGLTGYQVVVSQPLSAAPLQTVAQSATCPAGKVALSAGYVFAASNPRADQAAVERGLELLTAEPVWPANGQSFARVEMRNANAFEAATLTAIAICVDRRPDMRRGNSLADVAGATLANARGRAQLGCNPGEAVIGGGISSIDLGHVKASAPSTSGASWTTEVIQDAALAAVLPVFTSVVCAAASTARNLSVATSGPTALAGHGQIAQSAACPSGRRPLAMGVADGTVSTGIDMITVRLEPNSSLVDARIHNRNAIGGTASVVAQTVALCAEAAR